MIVRVWERAREARGLCAVAVATDDARVAEAVTQAGGRALLTDPELPSGTDRVAAAARALADEGLRFDAVVNVQGDEPLLDPGAIEACLEALRESGAPMATLARPLEAGEQDRPEVVKVVRDLRGQALYFSRAPLGRDRDAPAHSLALAHLGLYAYQADFLQTFTRLSPTPLEGSERLEQLRALEHGYPIAVRETHWAGLGVDTPEDLARARARFQPVSPR